MTLAKPGWLVYCCTPPITSFRFGSTIAAPWPLPMGLLGCCRVTGTARDDRGGGGRLLPYVSPHAKSSDPHLAWRYCP